MAIESVVDHEAPTEPALKALAGNDYSVYLTQAMAVADVLASGNNDQCDPRSLSDAGSLIYMLLRAASELIETERKELRQRKPATAAEAIA